MIVIVGIQYRNDARYTLCRSFLPIYGIAIIRSLSFLFLEDFEGNTNISVPIKSSSTLKLAEMSSNTAESWLQVKVKV